MKYIWRIQINDEIIGFNGFRVDGGAIEGSLAALKKGDEFNLFVSRDQILMEIVCKMGEIEIPAYKMSINSSSTNTQYCTYWLRTITK